ncbi:MAG: hypothetical protein JWN39_3959 [Ilumatobacteraceae bacterium]|nr:hypothetical protein [Ilumatobacteraceae bacterium]
MKKLITITMSVGLMLAAVSCSSDSKSSSTTAAASAASVLDTTASDASSGGDGGLSPTQAQAETLGAQFLESKGYVVDQACLEAVYAQFSEADAQLIVAAGADGDPVLSAEGQTISQGGGKCASLPTGASTPST